MTNGKAITILSLGIILLILLPVSVAETRRLWNMTQPQQQQAEPAPTPSQPEPRKTAIEMADQSGTHMAIFWRTPTQSGMAPRDVLESTIARMQYEQGTPLGNDRTAKALVRAMEALAILEGRSTETVEGFPIIE